MKENCCDNHCSCHHHHEQHETEPRMSKYDEALSKYNTNIDDEEVRMAVKKIITEKVHENDTLEVKKFLFGSIEPGGGILIGGTAGVHQHIHAGNGVEYRHGQIPVLLKGVGLKNGNRHGISPIS